MMIYSNQQDCENVKRIKDVDLQFMADQILHFVSVYFRSVYFDDPKYKDYLNTLYQIAITIKQRRYNEIFVDPSVIDYDVDIPIDITFNNH